MESKLQRDELEPMSSTSPTYSGIRGRRIALLVEGSRGDCQPYLALALRLRRKGCIVNVMSNSNYRDFVMDQGLDYTEVFSDFEEQMRDEAMQKAMKDGSALQFMEALSKLAKVRFPEDFEKACIALNNFKPQIVLFGMLSQTIAQLYGKLNDIPAIPVYLCVHLYTGEVAPWGFPTTFPLANRCLWKVVMKAMHKTGLEKVEMARAKIHENPNIIGNKLAIRDVFNFMPATIEEYIENANDPLVPKLIGCSPHVASLAEDVGCPNIHLTGWWILDCEHQVQRLEFFDANFGGADKEALEAFLGCGDAPVYVGWGSMIAVSPEFMTVLAVSALKESGQRGIVLKGSGNLGPDMLEGHQDLKAYAQDNILFINSAPHEWLLPWCSLTITHGGSGTTAASLRSGKPAIITPVFMDQFDFAAAVNRLGVGVGTPQINNVNAQILASAITKCLSCSAMRSNIGKLSARLLEEDGAGRAIEILTEFIEGPWKSGVWAKMEKSRQLRWAKTRTQGIFEGLLGCGRNIPSTETA